MPTPSANQYFEAAWTGTDDPSNPNLFTAAQLVAGSFDSAAVSTATSKAVSTVNAAAPDSTSISQARSQAVSAASNASIADSKAVSNSSNVSVADSKAISVSGSTSIADSKAVSVATATPVVTAVVYSSNISQADSKATSLAIGTPGGTRSTTNLGAYLGNNAVFNVRDYGATGDGLTDDTAAIKAAINALPVIGGTVFFPPGSYVITAELSTEINSKTYVRLLGAQGRTWRGNHATGPSQSILFVRNMGTYLYTKSGSTTDALEFENITVDGRNGGSPATTCPGVVNCNGVQMNYFGFRKSVATGFDYAHTNTAGSRGLFDLTAVWAGFDEYELSYVQNGRLLMIEGSTQVMLRRGEHTVARECYYIKTSDSVVFDHPVFESCAFIGASYLSQVTHRNPWWENVGYNPTTLYSTGIAQRNHGLTFGSGALQPAGGIVCPISQLYGSLRIENARIQGLAIGGGLNYTAPAWIEGLGQATGTSSGGSLSLSGKKSTQNGAQALFNTTMAFAAPERGTAFHVTVEDTHSTEGGAFGASLFVGSGIADARVCNRGFGRITMNDATIYIFSFHGGKLWHDIHDFNAGITLPPSVPGIAATKYPAGGQWETGDRIFFQPQVSAFMLGVECTTAGTTAPVWALLGQVEAPGSNKGDASPTLVSLGEATIVIFSSPLGANRTCTLPTPGTSFPRQKWRIVRTGLGAFTLTVQTSAAVALKVMPAATAAFVDVEYSTGAGDYILTAYGTL